MCVVQRYEIISYLCIEFERIFCLMWQIAVLILVFMSLSACRQEQTVRELGVFHTVESAPALDLDGIQQGGELIVATLYGAKSYYEYYGESFGTQYLLADEYAKSIGCAIRVEVVRSEDEMMDLVLAGDADVAACAVDIDSMKDGLMACGQEALTFVDSTHTVAWLVRTDAPMLAQSVNGWMEDNKGRFAQLTEVRVSDGKGRVYRPRRKAYSPILNLARGQISHYDDIFRKYSMTCGWDWKLLAAQAYQESSFDPNAVSSMGALGLMQLMPATARSVGVSIDRAFDAETNLRGAALYISRLNERYAPVADKNERLKFVLAAYNAGPGHIDDARNLARKYGADPDRWTGSVDGYVLRLSDSRYFNDPVVKHGYMRGNETYAYVGAIMERWQQYRLMK